MPSITTTDGYTFANWGPLTTTFTAPASCATATGNYMIAANRTTLNLEYAVQCSTLGYGDCIPTGTVSLSTTLKDNPYTFETQEYFSPGLYCPSGWATRGIAVRDVNKSLSSSGVLSSSTTVSRQELFPSEYPAMLLMGLLDPSETLVMCCPDSMTANLAHGCYSTVSDYKITEGCAYNIHRTDSISTKSIIMGGTTSTHLEYIVAATPVITLFTRTINPSETSQLVVVSVLPMLPLVHHQSDLPRAASTSNSAARASPNTNTWGGLGAFLGIYSVLLSAAVVLQ